jgi:uncharacterized protein YkwD
MALIYPFAGCNRYGHSGYLLWEYNGEYYTPDQLEAMDFSGTPVEPEAGAEEELLNRLNEYREALGLEPVYLVEELTLAAKAHAEYYALYQPKGLSAHAETTGDEGFTGVHPWDRADYYEYKGHTVSEVMSYLKPGTDVIDGLIDTVYHRLYLLDPFAKEIGYGYSSYDKYKYDYDYHYESYCNVIDIGLFYRYWLEDYERKSIGKVPVVVYPYNGQLDVPIEFGGEIPDPVPGDLTTAGYPITVQIGARFVDIVGNGAGLKDSSGNDVDFWFLTPELDSNGLLDNAVCILPTDTLKKGETYTVNVDLNLNENACFIYEWEFTTAE